MHFKRFSKVVQWRYSGGTVRYSEVQCPLLGYDLSIVTSPLSSSPARTVLGRATLAKKVEATMDGRVAHMVRMRHSSVHCHGTF